MINISSVVSVVWSAVKYGLVTMTTMNRAELQPWTVRITYFISIVEPERTSLFYDVRSSPSLTNSSSIRVLVKLSTQWIALLVAGLVSHLRVNNGMWVLMPSSHRQTFLHINEHKGLVKVQKDTSVLWNKNRSKKCSKYKLFRHEAMQAGDVKGWFVFVECVCVDHVTLVLDECINLCSY